MTRRDISLTLALCASLTLHALLLGSAAEWYVRKTGSHLYLPGYARQVILDPLLIPQNELPQPQQDPMDRLGDMSGKGKAIAESPGDLPMQARQAPQEQPFLSLDPAGPGQVGEDPSESMLPKGQNASAQAVQNEVAEAKPITPVPVPVAVSMGVGQPANDPAVPFMAEQLPQKPQPGQKLLQPEDPQPRQLTQAEPQPAAPVMHPGANTSADPAAQGTTESDPTSTVGSVEFRSGNTDVRLGRKFKLTRPHLTLAGQSDLMTLRTPSLILKISLDETGKVTSADVYRSCGSLNVDQPCQLAAYNWWFEPLKDKSGKPIKDVILFTIHFI